MILKLVYANENILTKDFDEVHFEVNQQEDVLDLYADWNEALKLLQILTCYENFVHKHKFVRVNLITTSCALLDHKS